MTCGSVDINSKGTDDYNPKIGLAGNHAYSLLRLYELVNINGQYQNLSELTGQKEIVLKGQKYQIRRLIKLRNPWGKLEWKGKWCDGDKRWNPML